MGKFEKGHKFSEETRKKISESNRGRIAWNKGKKFPQFSGKNSPHFGKHLTEEHIRKMVETRRKNGSYIGWNKGIPMSEETRLKVSVALKGKIPWNKDKKGIMPIPWNKGSKNGSLYSDEQRKNISNSHNGKVSNMLGKKHSVEAKRKMSLAKKGKFGEESNNWKGGISKDVHSTNESRYKKWREKVFTRDNFTCKVGGLKCKKYLQAHHIRSWKDYPELRYKVNNGITLCLDHHPRKQIETERLIPFFEGLITN